MLMLLVHRAHFERKGLVVSVLAGVLELSGEGGGLYRCPDTNPD